jgi:formate-dependent nitrite reductase membrane component NrfD
MILADAEHFVRFPEWTWYILSYFFFAGLSGGSYVIATLLRLTGRTDDPAARVGYYISFPTLLVCPVMLTLDLGQPLRFWHMLVNTTPGDVGPIFKYWSPMSVGAWALVVFAFFSTASFVESLVRDGKLRFLAWSVRPLRGFFGTLFSVVGMVAGLFITGYTGVLLAVSNQPVWSDTWTLGALFLASALSGSAALIGWLVRYRRDAEGSSVGLARGERYFQVLELLLIVAFAVTLIPAGTLAQAFGFPWLLLWVVALFGLVVGLSGRGAARPAVNPDGTVALRAARALAAPSAIIVLIGVLALRAAVIFSAQ